MSIYIYYMCGIFGYIGAADDAAVKTLRGLKHLEYRGYDSWGIAVCPDTSVGARNDSGIVTKKSVGKISAVREQDFANIRGSSAIGHSRWATHGGVSKKNAHPHFNSTGTIAVVHNGIIENAEILKHKLLVRRKERLFVSDTDTEVIPHLIDWHMRRGASFEKAVRDTCREITGRFAFVAMHRNEDALIAARAGSPLIIGKGVGEYFIASDTPAFLDYTQTVRYLDDGEYAVISKGKAIFKNFITGRKVQKKDIVIVVDNEAASKGEWDHFMLKEIMEQKDALARAINQNEKEIKRIADEIKNARGVFLSGCGTAGKVCMSAEYFFAVVAGRHTNFTPASEFPLYHHFLTKKTLLIVVSQSGETADVLEAMKVAREKGAKVLSLVNVPDSSVARASDFSLRINAGPEKAVASTKAATSQLALLLLIAYATAGKLKEGKESLIRTVGKINNHLNPKYLEYIKRVARRIYKKEDVYIIGKSFNYPMALEAAIKIQEVSYIHAEGFAGGELKHGPIALIGKGTPCIALVAEDETKSDMLSNTAELKARGASIIGIAPENNKLFDTWISVPKDGPASPIVNLIPIQILAYYLAVLRGNNPDMPRNLAKSVTVK